MWTLLGSRPTPHAHIHGRVLLREHAGVVQRHGRVYPKRIQGCLYGMMSPSRDVLRLLGLWETGHLKLEELVTRTYAHDEINVGYSDMLAGEIVRGVIEYDKVGVDR